MLLSATYTGHVLKERRNWIRPARKAKKTKKTSKKQILTSNSGFFKHAVTLQCQSKIITQDSVRVEALCL